MRSEPSKEIKEKIANLFGPDYYSSKRRSRLGLSVQNLGPHAPRNYRACPFESFFVDLPGKFLSSEVLSRDDRWQLLRRAKLFLSLRRVGAFASLFGLDWRRDWNKDDPNRPVEKLIDLFPSLKYSYETMLPLTARMRKRGIDPSSIDWSDSPWNRMNFSNKKSNNSQLDSLFFDSLEVVSRPCVPTARDLFRDDYVDLVSSDRDGVATVRFGDVCRSHGVWLDPIDAPIELYKWRLRVQRSICWAYENGFVPVMMTLTIFHRWHPLKKLLNVLQKSWDKFLVSGRPAARRRMAMGLEGYVRRLEITINDGLKNRLDVPEGGTNSGWHPHYHVILFLPREKLSIVSDMESQLKKDWVRIVSENFMKEFGEPIERSYILTFIEHGLHFSRCDVGPLKNQLRPVKDSVYLDKIQGYDSLRAYGVDKEVSSEVVKDSKIPFDLLREVTATNIDLWCEYAIATKGVPALQFSRPIIKKIDSYFEAHPDKNPVPSDLPPSKVVAHLEHTIYRLFYRNFLIPELKKKASEGFEVLYDWVKEKLVELGVSALCDDPTALPRPPNSVDDLLAKKIVPSTS